MSNSFTKHRAHAFTNQDGRCYYCTARMWLQKSAEFATKHGVSEREAARFQCTAEHLVARQDGGTNQPQNIVAACRFCNVTRHRRLSPLPSDRYRSLVSRRLNCLKWHPAKFRFLLQNPIS